ncbi:MAG: hypothetical protein K9H65_00970 [Bacteroidales bacterium]|nr:hypothetical protein [Bacteroidales bacterium]
MDIEKLKWSWKKYTSELKEKEVKETSELKEILRQKSQHALTKLRKNFLIEAGVNIAAIPVLFIIVVNGLVMVEPLKYYLSFFLVFLVVMFLIFLYRSYTRIYRYENFRLPLEEKLEEQIFALKKFMRKYERISYILYFVAIIFGLLTTTINDPTELVYKSVFAIVVGLLVFFVAIKPLTKYYLNRLYGRHLQSLRQYLDELKEITIDKNHSND